MPSPKNILIALLLFIGIGLVGAIPFIMIGLIFGNFETAQNIYALEAIILASWLPIKALADSQIKGEFNFRLPNIRLSSVSLVIILVGFMLIIPFLYAVTFSAFLAGALGYAFSGGNLLVGILVALGMQTFNVVRGSQREKESGVGNNIFMRVQDVGSSGFDISIDPESIQRQTPRQDEAPILYLPEDNLRDYEPEPVDETPITITLDPDNISEQGTDEA
ncbi:MAG: hypothetical protein Phog2KO_06650 [Phototrophicaceae bacterium]